MTAPLSQLLAESAEELNKRCAEVLGARWFDVGDGFGKWRCLTFLEEGAENHPRCGPLPIPINGIGLWRVPDYCADLNAVHAEVVKLTGKQSFKFIEYLCEVVEEKPIGEFAFTWIMITSTAKQRTIALILCLTH